MWGSRNQFLLSRINICCWQQSWRIPELSTVQVNWYLIWFLCLSNRAESKMGDYRKWSHWREITCFFLVFREMISDCLKGDFWTTSSLFCSMWCIFRRASVALCVCNWNMRARANTPTPHLTDKKWTSVTSCHPCQGHFGNPCTAKDLWIWAVVTRLLFLSASPCNCGLFVEYQLCVLTSVPVECSWGGKSQLLLLNDSWWWEVVMESIWNSTFEAHVCVEYLAPPAHLSWMWPLHRVLPIAHHPPSPGTEVLSFLEKQ